VCVYYEIMDMTSRNIFECRTCYEFKFKDCTIKKPRTVIKNHFVTIDANNCLL